jgi:hypothetical protein
MSAAVLRSPIPKPGRRRPFSRGWRRAPERSQHCRAEDHGGVATLRRERRLGGRALTDASAHPLYPQVLAWLGWIAMNAGDVERGIRVTHQEGES